MGLRGEDGVNPMILVDLFGRALIASSRSPGEQSTTALARVGLWLSRSEWEERKLAFGVALLNGWDDSTSVLPRARHRLVLGSDDTLPRRSGVPRNVA